MANNLPIYIHHDSSLPKKKHLKIKISKWLLTYFTSILPQKDNDPLLEVDFYRAFSDLRNFVARKVTKQTLWSKVTFNALIYMRFKDALAGDALKTSIRKRRLLLMSLAPTHQKIVHILQVLGFLKFCPNNETMSSRCLFRQKHGC